MFLREMLCLDRGIIVGPVGAGLRLNNFFMTLMMVEHSNFLCKRSILTSGKILA